MGEGAALFVLKRLADAERDGDRIYAVVRGLGGASDGKGKGITAPNPVGQRLAVERALAQRRARSRRLLAGRGPRHVDRAWATSSRSPSLARRVRGARSSPAGRSRSAR